MQTQNQKPDTKNVSQYAQEELRTQLQTLGFKDQFINHFFYLAENIHIARILLNHFKTLVDSGFLIEEIEKIFTRTDGGFGRIIMLAENAAIIKLIHKENFPLFKIIVANFKIRGSNSVLAHYMKKVFLAFSNKEPDIAEKYKDFYFQYQTLLFALRKILKSDKTYYDKIMKNQREDRIEVMEALYQHYQSLREKGLTNNTIFTIALLAKGGAHRLEALGKADQDMLHQIEKMFANADKNMLQQIKKIFLHAAEDGIPVFYQTPEFEKVLLTTFRQPYPISSTCSSFLSGENLLGTTLGTVCFASLPHADTFITDPSRLPLPTDAATFESPVASTPSACLSYLLSPSSDTSLTPSPGFLTQSTGVLESFLSQEDSLSSPAFLYQPSQSGIQTNPSLPMAQSSLPDISDDDELFMSLCCARSADSTAFTRNFDQPQTLRRSLFPDKRLSVSSLKKHKPKLSPELEADLLAKLKEIPDLNDAYLPWILKYSHPEDFEKAVEALCKYYQELKEKNFTTADILAITFICNTGSAHLEIIAATAPKELVKVSLQEVVEIFTNGRTTIDTKQQAFKNLLASSKGLDTTSQTLTAPCAEGAAIRKGFKPNASFPFFSMGNASMLAVIPTVSPQRSKQPRTPSDAQNIATDSSDSHLVKRFKTSPALPSTPAESHQRHSFSLLGDARSSSSSYLAPATRFFPSAAAPPKPLTPTTNPTLDDAAAFVADNFSMN